MRKQYVNKQEHRAVKERKKGRDRNYILKRKIRAR